MTTQIKAGVIAANAVNSSELASGALSGQNFTGDVIFSGTTQGTRLGLGVAPHATAGLNITTTNQHIRLNNGSELSIIHVLSTGELELWGHGDGESINFRTGSGAGTVAMNIIGNNVGITNTSTLNANLHIGSANATGDATNPALQIGGASTYRLGIYTSTEGAVIANANGDDGIQFVVKTAGEAMRIDGGTGNVGIGTTSPTADLSVGSTSTSSGDVHLRTTKTAFSITPSNTDAGGILFDLGWVNGGQGPMKFGINGSEKMRIDSSGTVAIGNTSPPTTNTFAADMFIGPSLFIANYSSGSNQQSVFGNNTYYNSGYRAVTGDTSASMVNFSQGSIIFDTATTVTTDSAQSFTTKMIIKNNGNVGIGTDSPSVPLHINSLSQVSNRLAIFESDINNLNEYSTISVGSNTLSANFGLMLTTSDTAYIGVGSSGNVFDPTTGTGLYVNANGNVGISTSSPSAKLEVIHGTVSQGNGVTFGRTASQSWDFWGDSGANVLYSKGNFAIIGTSDSQDLSFRTNNTDRMRITSAGTLLVSTTTSSGLSNGTSNYGHSFGGGQQVNATNNDTNLILNMSNGSSNAHVLFRSNGSNTGNISTNGSAVAFNTGSDYRLKENVIPLKDSLDRVNKLKPVQFDWKDSQKTDEGFIAHEVQEIVPYVVKGEKDGKEIQTMDYGKLTPLLVKAIQEQQTIIDDLKSRITKLEG